MEAKFNVGDRVKFNKNSHLAPGLLSEGHTKESIFTIKSVSFIDEDYVEYWLEESIWAVWEFELVLKVLNIN